MVFVRTVEVVCGRTAVDVGETEESDGRDDGVLDVTFLRSESSEGEGGGGGCGCATDLGGRCDVSVCHLWSCYT